MSAPSMTCPAWCQLTEDAHDDAEALRGPYVGALIRSHEKWLPGLVVDGQEVVSLSLTAEDVSRPSATDRTPVRLLLFAECPVTLAAEDAEALASVLLRAVAELRSATR